MALKRVCIWIGLTGGSVGLLLYSGADVVFCVVFVGWLTVAAITRECFGAQASGIASGSITAAVAAYAVWMRTGMVHPTPPMEGAVIVIPGAFVVGYGLSLAVGALVMHVAKRMG